MGERNDLIERRWIGVVPSGLQGPAKVTRLERVAEIWRNQGLFVTEWVPATTIASLYEALAEAEKKGAEAVADICEALADEDDVLAMNEGLEDWEVFQHRWAERRLRYAAKVARDLSQGGQHG